MSSVLAFCTEEDIKSAWISGIGAVESATLSTYDLDKKEYKSNNLEGRLELLNLTGNIGTLDGKIVAHLHCTIADGNAEAFGGHLTKAIVSATCEILITKIDFQIRRGLDPRTGLNLID